MLSCGENRFLHNLKNIQDEKTERFLPSYIFKTIKFKLQDEPETFEYEKNVDYMSMIASYFEYLSKALWSGYLATYFIRNMNLLKRYSMPFLKFMALVANNISKDLSTFLEQ